MFFSPTCIPLVTKQNVGHTAQKLLYGPPHLNTILNLTL